jgi:hypothetical protein
MDFVVQNRSGQALGGLQLNVATGTSANTYAISTFAAGASTVIKVPVDQNAIKASGGLTFTTQLTNPTGVIDRVPANNRKTSTLAPVK